MAIIRASKSFEGGDLSQKASSYIKQNTRTVDFKNKENGVYLFILGGYKVDNAGNGVWYRPLKIRDNFGMGMYKEKLAVQPNCPIDYFSNKVQTFAPDMAKSKESVDDSGRKRWIYPAWGRTAWRVLYNAAIFNDYNSGVHVLDLPQSGGASVIDEHVRGRQADGTPNPDITDYEHAVPINIKLDLKANGQPWKIAIQTQKTYQLPIELADTDYLYNLDDVIIYQSKQTLIEKLKSLVPTDVFRKGMEGYSDGLPVTITSSESASNVPPVPPVPTLPQDEVPMVFENPMIKPNIPKANTSIAPIMNIPKANAKPMETPAFKPKSTSEALAAAASYLQNK
jgi:hypothetical protein